MQKHKVKKLTWKYAKKKFKLTLEVLFTNIICKKLKKTH